MCLRETDSREALLQDLRWLIGAEAARPALVRLDGAGAETAVQAEVARVAPALVVLTNDRWSLLRRRRSGLVTRVVRRCATPVYVVPRPEPGRTVEPRPKRILVALNGTERAAAVLPFVERLALAHESEVVLARIERRGFERPLLAMQLTRERVRETLAPWVDRLARLGIPVTAVAGYGRPSVELPKLAAKHRIDLLAMTTRGRTGFERWVDRSVFDDVVGCTSLPVVVVPTPEV